MNGVMKSSCFELLLLRSETRLVSCSSRHGIKFDPRTSSQNDRLAYTRRIAIS